jgi:catechol 2,3-dioxygenase-like lactoylglutathione lyase family enzyme
MGVKLDMIGITAADVDASLAFYRKLGLDAPETSNGEPYVEMEVPGGIRLSWNALSMVKEIDPGWSEPSGHRMGLAYLCDSPAEVNERYNGLVAAGYQSHKAPWDAFWGQRYAQILDPDGNIVDLFAALE